MTGSNDVIAVLNPARPDDVVGTVARATVADVNRAVAAAKAAQPAWGAKSFVERARILAHACKRLSHDIEGRAIVYTRENGRILVDARGELGGLEKRAEQWLELAPALDEGKSLAGTLIRYVPYGVVLSIVPWNAPVGLGFSQIFTALLCGNSVVVKPPETCPLALMRTIDLFAAELPADLVKIVTGFPRDIGDALTTHPDIDKIAFTGSIGSARHIMANAAMSIKGITLELGGNDPAIVLSDADLGAAAMARMVRATFRMSGQVCMAIKRIYVANRLRSDFLAAYGEVAGRIVVGDGLVPSVTMGPLHNAQGLEKARELIADAEKHGAKVMPVGTFDESGRNKTGHFLLPTIVTDIPDAARLVAEEQFCPVVPVLGYDDVGEVIERANATDFGLGGSVWGRDADAALSVAKRIQAGTVWINTHGTEALNRKAPYGGIKQSGIGRKSGLEGMMEYVQVQTLTTFAEAV